MPCARAMRVRGCTWRTHGGGACSASALCRRTVHRPSCRMYSPCGTSSCCTITSPWEKARSCSSCTIRSSRSHGSLANIGTDATKKAFSAACARGTRTRARAHACAVREGVGTRARARARAMPVRGRGRSMHGCAGRRTRRMRDHLLELRASQRLAEVALGDDEQPRARLGAHARVPVGLVQQRVAAEVVGRLEQAHVDRRGARRPAARDARLAEEEHAPARGDGKGGGGAGEREGGRKGQWEGRLADGRSTHSPRGALARSVKLRPASAAAASAAASSSSAPPSPSGSGRLPTAPRLAITCTRGMQRPCT